MKEDISKILKGIKRNLFKIEEIIVLYENNPNLDRGLLARSNSFFSYESAYCSCVDYTHSYGMNIKRHQKRHDLLIKRFDKLTGDYFEKIQLKTRFESEERKRAINYFESGESGIGIRVVSTKQLGSR